MIRKTTTRATQIVSTMNSSALVETQDKKGVRMPAIPPGMIDPGEENSEETSRR